MSTSTWPEGFRRPKEDSDRVAQVVWTLFGVIGCVGFASSGLGFHAVGCLVVAIFSVVWVEFQARCENRQLVLVAFGAIMILEYLWARHHRAEAQRQQQNRQY